MYSNAFLAIFVQFSTLTQYFWKLEIR